MADNTTRPLTSGGDTVRSDDEGADKIEVSKIATGASGVDGGLVTLANPLAILDYRASELRERIVAGLADRNLLLRQLVGSRPGGASIAFWQVPFSGVPVPFLASANYTLGDTGGGGQSIVLAGSGFDATTTVKVAIMTATVTAFTPTSLTFTLPTSSVTPGVYSIVASNSSGSSNSLSFEYWSPTQITGVTAVYDAEKGITQSGGTVSTWADQTASAFDLLQATTANQPTWAASSFGSMHGVTFNNVGGPGTSNLMQTAVWHSQTAGLSRFWVGSYSGTNTTHTGYAGDNPYTVIGDSTGVVKVNVGHNAGALSYQYFVSGVGWVETTDGSGLNDAAVRLYGWTHDTSGNVSAYVGATQQGTTTTGITYDTVNTGWNTAGQGFGGNADGFNGTLGAIVIVGGVIGGTDLTKLNAWAQQRFGTP